LLHPAPASFPPQALRPAGVAVLVAPYEADAQMAYLARSGVVAAVVTEDSDLVAYACPR
jgi:exonuclease-1